MKTKPLDTLDKAILSALVADGRQSQVQLAERIPLSPTAIARRIKGLEEQGVIEGYRAQVNRAALGGHVAVFAEVTLKDQRQATVQRFERHIVGCREVVACWLVSGRYDYLLRLGCRDLSHYHSLTNAWLEEVGLGIDRIVTNTELQTVKEFTGFPVA